MDTLTISRRRRDQLERLRAEQQQAISDAERKAAQFQKALAMAREEGATVKELQELLQVNRARIYQLLSNL
jgi:hypothetical protein